MYNIFFLILHKDHSERFLNIETEGKAKVVDEEDSIFELDLVLFMDIWKARLYFSFSGHNSWSQLR